MRHTVLVIRLDCGENNYMDVEKFNPEEERGQANAVINGFYFQVVAALHVFLHDMKSYSEIGFEKQDDFVLKRKDGTYDFGQAKSSLGYEAINDNHLQEIQESLKPLSAHDEKKTHSYISIFNYRKPFGPHYPTIEGNEKKLGEINLPKDLLDTLADYVENLNSSEKNEEKPLHEINLKKLHFWFLSFEDELPTMVTKDLLRERLFHISGEAVVLAESILRRWNELLIRNGRVKKDFIDVGIFLGTLYAAVLSVSLNLELISRDAGLDISFIAQDSAKNALAKFFDSFSANIVLFFQILGPYMDHVAQTGDYSVANYVAQIQEVPREIGDLLDPISDLDQLSVYKLLSAYVINKRNLYDKIRKAFAYGTD